MIMKLMSKICATDPRLISLLVLLQNCPGAAAKYGSSVDFGK
jgi:hypothetical protein